MIIVNLAFSGYYEVVENPIDIIKIQQKLKTDEYSNIEELQVDFDLIVANTKQFYKRGSAEYRDATELGGLVTKAVEAVSHRFEKHDLILFVWLLRWWLVTTWRLW